jgi:mono/diheme cytochrome c family protein
VVKTFAMDMEPGNPASRRRLETRVMLKQGANWAGYTYIWNDAQTDAELAPAAGVDQTLTIKDPAAPSGERKQTYHYPSRAECLVCHSRAANFLLGVSDVQLAREFDYGNGHVDHQLRTLEHLGVLKVDQAGPANEQLKKEARATGMNPDEAGALAGRLTDTKGQREAPKSTLLYQPPQTVPHLVSPTDPNQTINDRARSYLHANCAHCHVEAGGGNASVDLDYATEPAKAKMFDVPAQSNVLANPQAKLIATGHPELSNLHHRMAIRGTGQMPPVGSNVIDADGARLIEEWIRQMPASTQPVR